MGEIDIAGLIGLLAVTLDLESREVKIELGFQGFIGLFQNVIRMRVIGDEQMSGKQVLAGCERPGM